ncbi:MAG: hypothetical protein IPJ00_19130 [Saprospirales bacterium]|nr:hypothetical protein [Saprospirales bacterium]
MYTAEQQRAFYELSGLLKKGPLPSEEASEAVMPDLRDAICTTSGDITC